VNILLIGPKRIYDVYDRMRKGRRIDWHEELFREELARHHNVTFWGKGYTAFYNKKMLLQDIIDMMWPKPDIILWSYSEIIVPGFNEVKIPKVCISAGFFEANPECSYGRKHEYFFSSHKFDIAFGQVIPTVDYLKKRGISEKVFLLPAGVEIKRFRKLDVEKIFDVSAMYASRKSFYRYRKSMICAIKDLPNITTFTSKVGWDDYVVKINQSKICINESIKLGILNNRVNEVMACGTLLISDSTAPDYSFLGYEPGKHFVDFDNIDDFVDKINFYLNHPDERKRIASEGMRFVRERFSMTKRVEKFIELVEENL